MIPFVLDSFAILALLNREPGADRVRVILDGVVAGTCQALMCAANLGEVFYIVKRRKAAIMYLLLSRAEGQLDDFDSLRVVKERVGRIIEGEMTVLANAGAHDINRRLGQKFSVAFAFRLRRGSKSIQVMHHARLDAVIQALVQIAHEGLRSRGPQTNVLVHVKGDHP